MAIITARRTESTGVITRLARASRRRPSVGQERTQTPQPRHRSSWSVALRRFGLCGSLADTSAIASTGQAVTHLPQPLHLSASIDAMKLVVWMGWNTPYLRAAVRASQQHPQQ